MSENETVPGVCIITEADIAEINEAFKTAAESLPGGKTVDREKLNPPFIEPINVGVSIYKHPSSLKYVWTVDVQSGCIYESANPRSEITSVEFNAEISDQGRSKKFGSHIFLKGDPRDLDKIDP